MRIIAVNGEKGSGKTTFATQLEAEVKKLDKEIQVFQGHLKAPLEAMLRGMFANRVKPDLPYEQLKTIMLGGHTGRDWLIALGNMMHEFDVGSLSRIMYEKYDMTQDNLLIIDDIGRESEYAQMLHVPHGNICALVSMEKRGTRAYGHGQLFDGDNRVCLRGHARFIDPDPVVVARFVLGIPEVQPEIDSASKEPAPLPTDTHEDDSATAASEVKSVDIPLEFQQEHLHGLVDVALKHAADVPQGAGQGPTLKVTLPPA